MAHPEKPSSRKKRTTNAQTAAPSEHPVSPSLAAQPTVAPGAIPPAGTGTELEALRRTQEASEILIVDDQAAAKTLASRLAAAAPTPVYDASIVDQEAPPLPAGEGLTITDPLNQVTHQTNPETGTLATIDNTTLDSVVKRFNGVEMTEISIPHSAAIDSTTPVVGSTPDLDPATRLSGTLQLSEAEAYALNQQQVVAEDQAIVDAQDAVHAPTQFENKRRTTRLKMTLHSLTPLDGDADNPLTRCTFGAVYSSNPDEEDGVFGKYTPYGQLSYNVRSDIAEHLEQGQAYYIDISKVPS